MVSSIKWFIKKSKEVRDLELAENYKDSEKLRSKIYDEGMVCMSRRDLSLQELSINNIIGFEE